MLQPVRRVALTLVCGLQDSLDRLVPEGGHFRHLDEGLDDMPAHVKVKGFAYLSFLCFRLFNDVDKTNT